MGLNQARTLILFLAVVQILILQRDDGNVGIGINMPAAKLHVAGIIRHRGIVQESDERLKENIQILDSSLDKIAMLLGVSYQWRDKKDYGNRTHIGLLAQNIETVFLELFFIANDEKRTKAVDCSGLVAPLIESVKQLKEENETLKIQAVTLKAQTAALKALICKDHQKAAIS